MGMIERREGETMTTQRGRSIWRLYIRGAGSYCQGFPDYFTKDDVRKRTEAEGCDVIDVEPVT